MVRFLSIFALPLLIISLTISPARGVSLTGGASFGTSTAIVDLNADGFDDTVVGQPSTGQAFVYYGGAIPNGVADVVLAGAGNFGTAVAPAGDVNGDSRQDVVVVAQSGSMYVYFGGPSFDNVADWIPTTASFAGFAVAAGDVNGDLKSDIIVGDYTNSGGGTGRGRVLVWFGGASPDVVPDLTMSGFVNNDNFGFSVAAADLNHDGYDDVVCGSINDDTAGPEAGRAFVYFGGPSPNNVHDLALTGAASDDRFGYSVGAAGDFNDDGHPDVIVGAFQNDVGGSNAGQAYVYLGGPGLDAVPDFTLTGAVSGGKFGNAVTGVGDVNGDGFDDVAVGAFWTNADAGRVYLFHGGPAPDASADRIVEGTDQERFGTSIGGSGDVNGDDRNDLVVGAPWAGITPGSRAYLFVTGDALPAASAQALSLIGAVLASIGVAAMRRRSREDRAS